eukprot:XP_011675375.1 PREDICTED: multidrug resistance-associated protein 5 [Strongylocentrotus purpuratus]
MIGNKQRAVELGESAANGSYYTLNTAQAVLVQRLLEYTEEEEVDLWSGIVLVVSIFILQIVRITGDVFSRSFNCRTATRLRSGMLTVAFRKLANLRSLQQHSVGEIVNICANDSQRLFNVCVVGNFLISSPALLLATLITTQFIVGSGALIGTLATFILFVPMQVMAGKTISKIRIQCIEIIDVRVQKMHELVTYIKLIKMYAWELPFAKSIKALRRQEKSHLEKAGMLQSFSLSNVPIIPSLASVLSIIIHIYMGNSLTAAEAFTLVSLLNVCRAVIGPAPFAVRMLAESNVALDRLKSIMIMDKAKANEKLEDSSENMVEIRGGEFGWDDISYNEDAIQDDITMETTSEDTNKNEVIDTNGSGDPEVMIKNGSHNATDSNGIKEQTSDVKQHECNSVTDEFSNNIVSVLFDVNFDLPNGHLVGVCGSVGSGKSSLVNAILGQMEKVKGTCKVRGKFAYVAQEAWIFNATVRENILFGKPMDEKRYAMVLEACSLKQDLTILTNGDETEIAERGINLSGGQKQRVSLARAVYADHDVYFLDDPLSAVDAHVGEHIFTRCINGILNEKTILFVTHQLQYHKKSGVRIFGARWYVGVGSVKPLTLNPTPARHQITTGKATAPKEAGYSGDSHYCYWLLETLLQYTAYSNLSPMFSEHESIATSLPPVDTLPTRMEGNHLYRYSKVLEAHLGEPRARPLPACPQLAWAIGEPLNFSAPSNLYKHQKLLSVPEAFLPLVRRNGQPAAPQLMKEENEPHGPGGFNPNLSASGLDQFWGIPLIGLFSVLLVMGFLFYQVQQRRTRPRRRKPYRLKKSYPHASSSLHYGKMPAV